MSDPEQVPQQYSKEELNAMSGQRRLQLALAQMEYFNKLKEQKIEIKAEPVRVLSDEEKQEAIEERKKKLEEIREKLLTYRERRRTIDRAMSGMILEQIKE